MLELQNAILEMVARGEALPAVADHLCRRVEALAPGALCSVLEVDEAGILHPIAAPSLPESYSAALDGTMIGPLVGSCGSAAYLGSPVTVLDIEHDSRWADFVDLALPLGLRACWSSPILDGQSAVIGTFAFYYRECRGPNAIEQELVRTCVHLCTIAISHNRWQSEQKRRAFYDSQTKLPNRSAFNAAIARLACDIPGSWALLVVDLDNLKIVNDTFGHHIGDHLIGAAAERIARVVAPDKAYRLGGDEFAVLVQAPESLKDLERLAKSILAELNVHADCGGHSVIPRATIGGALLSAGDAGAERVRQNADIALYHAKETARGSFVRYWDEIGSGITRRLSAISSVNDALRDGRLLAHYQPILRLDTREIVGFEALCRIRDGGRLLPAGSFRQATADLAVAKALTERMLVRVAADMRDWQARGLDFDHIAINLCAADFHGGKLAAQLSSIFNAQHIPLTKIVLEVNETVSMAQADRQVCGQIEALRALGVRMALDDFGGGHGSLIHLMAAPFDIVKIDRSLIDRLAEDRVARAVVESVLHIARELPAQVVAAGVESAEQADLLAAAGCRLVQGHLFAAAVDAASATQLLQDRKKWQRSQHSEAARAR